jgi:hypothetical protein
MSKRSFCQVGTRVNRGPDWIFGNKDGGEGNAGTVVGPGLADQHVPRDVLVKWDNVDAETTCRVGANGKHDLILAISLCGSLQVKIKAGLYFSDAWLTASCMYNSRTRYFTCTDSKGSTHKATMCEMTGVPNRPGKKQHRFDIGATSDRIALAASGGKEKQRWLDAGLLGKVPLEIITVGAFHSPTSFKVAEEQAKKQAEEKPKTEAEEWEELHTRAAAAGLDNKILAAADGNIDEARSIVEGREAEAKEWEELFKRAAVLGVERWELNVAADIDEAQGLLEGMEAGQKAKKEAEEQAKKQAEEKTPPGWLLAPAEDDHWEAMKEEQVGVRMH